MHAHTMTSRYRAILLGVAGLGGLLYGIDVGIIAGALPYLEATSGFTSNQLSVVVAAVLLGSVLTTLFAGMLADWIGRKKLMAVSGLMFVVSIPLIALSHGYGPLVLGRTLQGMSGGLIGVVVPLYLAECLGASDRGKGTGMFQWLLTLGIVAAAVIGLYFSVRVERVGQWHDAAKLFAFKDSAWRLIFWVSLPPGILFVFGSLFVAESPRWLYRRGRKDAARAALLRSCGPREAGWIEWDEVEAAWERASMGSVPGGPVRRDSLLGRKYIVPFVLACVILACNQATGVNSIIGYNATILIQAGLTDKQAHIGYVVLTLVNFLSTLAGVVLVDRVGRRVLLIAGSSGIVMSLLGTGLVFRQTERQRVDCAAVVQSMVAGNQDISIPFGEAEATRWLGDRGTGGDDFRGRPKSLVVIYSYGGFRAATKAVRSSEKGARIELHREGCVPSNGVVAFFENPFANLEAARTAPLRIENALVEPIPDTRSGVLAAAFICCFMVFFAVGPGVCVWLALSELMPTRIRSNGMSVALLINQAVSTGIAVIFLPTVGKFGYGTMFFAFAACTIVYLVTALFFLPETKGKTLEEIECHFAGKSVE